MTDQPPAQSTENEARRLDADRIQAALRYYLPPGENQDAALAALARIIAALSDTEAKLREAEHELGERMTRIEDEHAAFLTTRDKLRECREALEWIRDHDYGARGRDSVDGPGIVDIIDRALTRSNGEEAK